MSTPSRRLRVTLGLARVLSAVTLAAIPSVTLAQNESIIVEAESGTVGAQFSTANDGATQYIAIQSTVAGGNPTTAARVASYTVTFPSAGTYELYARMRVGPGTFNDDSFYYANGFGAKNPASDLDWILTNQLAGNVGFTLPGDKVVGGGPAQSQVWKWVKLSAFDGGEPPVAGFPVSAGNLVQTFQVAGREDGLWLDKFAFGRQGVFFTVFELDNGLPGSTVPPPPPYVPPGPPIATGQPKFLGGVSSPSQNLNFRAYWNQVTPENGGKWASVEATRDFMTWGDLDTAYALAKNNGFPFRLHTLIWGNQQPAWIEALPPAEQREEIEEWFAALAARYPDIDFIDVVNEPLHDPPDGPGDGNYIAALGGSGVTGWDWVLESFRLAREHFPNANLGINEFSVTNTTSDMLRYIGIVGLLQAEGLIDSVGVQGHAFSTRVPNTVTEFNLNLLAAGTGLPIYVTELDIDGPTDEVQLADYQRIFPVFWEHPAVRGITLWGYRPGHWRTAQGAYIVHENGAERPAMVWLQGYVATTALRPWITAQPSSVAATVGDDVTFTVAGDGTAPLAYQWRKDGVAISGNPSATTPTLTLTFVRTADAGSYDCVVSNVAGEATSAAASLTVAPDLATVTLSGLSHAYDGAPHGATVTTSPAGLAVVVTYDGGAALPVWPGRYLVEATVNDPDYVGVARGTLVITTRVRVRHAPTLNGAVDGSVQVHLPESVTLNGGASVSGDLLVPGTPSVRLNGHPTYGGTLSGLGAASPSGHTITLNGGATLRHVVSRTDAAGLPTVDPPPTPTGTRNVVLNGPGGSPGDFATLRNLTLNGNAGQVAVPAGTYGTFIANGNSGFILGTPGATEPAAYNLQGLVLNGGSRLEVAGPVVLTVGSSVIVNGTVGAAGSPERLLLQVSSGGLTLNGNATVHGFVAAPAGTVMVNGTLIGGLVADRLTVNGGGRLDAE
jgi:endo-1,4-beta-xylanase